jgi:hypothetical protein
MIGRKDQINTEEVTTRSLDDFYDKPAPASQFFWLIYSLQGVSSDINNMD